MPDDGNGLPTVEGSPVVNAPEPAATPSAPASTPAAPAAPAAIPLTEERFQQLLGDFEKRIGQSARDAAKATVNKALGIPTKAQPQQTAPATQPQAAAPASTPAQPATTPTQPATQPSAVPDVQADPVLQQTYALLQKDGVAVQDGVDPIVFEAYRTQASAGVHLAPTDPEFQMIDNRSVTSYLASVAAAAEAKKARMIEEGTYQGDTVTNNAPVLTPGLVTGTAPSRLPHEGKSGSETLSMFFSKGR